MSADRASLKQIGGTTPFLNVLLDRLMPRLRDVEWRIVCVVIRQTFGWPSPDGTPKQSDWLSHAQLRRKTGRSSAALSPAIEFLCRNRILDVRSELGDPLPSSTDRRRHRGRLYFRLSDRVVSEETKRFRLKSRIQKTAATKDTHTNAVVVPAKKQHENAPKSGIQNPVTRQEWERVGENLKSKRYNSLHR